MKSSPADPITELIAAAQAGRKEAWDRVYELLYEELHAAARLQISQWRDPGNRSPTSLINRAWMRIDEARLDLQGRRQLVGILAQAMRYALLDEARRLQAYKRPKEMPLDDLHEHQLPTHDPRLEQLIALNQALEALSDAHPRLAQMVEMRYFAEMTEVEIAQVLDVNTRTVRRDWRKAQAFLAVQLGATPHPFA